MNFIPPFVSSVAQSCTIPFQIETYYGCTNSCIYCFARGSTASRKHTTQEIIQSNDPIKFKKLIDRWANTETKNYKDYGLMFFKNRIPFAIGTRNDPCPNIESKIHTTEKFLQALSKYDYPFRILTKNPKVLYNILKNNRNLNCIPQVSITSLDEQFIKKTEPNAPSISERLTYIEMIAALKYPVMATIKPVIYPNILTELESLILELKNRGVWAFNIDALFLKKNCKQEFKDIYNVIKPNFYNDYSKYCIQGDKTQFNLKPEFEFEIIELCLKLSKKYDIKYFGCFNYGMEKSSDQCCGTEKLRNYNIFRYNIRSAANNNLSVDDIAYTYIKPYGDIKGKGYNPNPKHETFKDHIDRVIGYKLDD